MINLTSPFKCLTETALSQPKSLLNSQKEEKTAFVANFFFLTTLPVQSWRTDGANLHCKREFSAEDLSLIFERKSALGNAINCIAQYSSRSGVPIEVYQLHELVY